MKNSDEVFESHRKLTTAALLREVEVDWSEVKRLAQLSAYNNWTDVQRIINEQAKALDIRSPYDPNE